MVETLSTISIICFVASGVCLVAAIIIFIVFRIPSVIGDLSGRTARKSVARYRTSKERAGAGLYKTDTVEADGEHFRINESQVENGRYTDSVGPKAEMADKVSGYDPEEGTTQLDRGEENTTSLYDGEEATRPLNTGGEGTMPLYDSNETTPLYSYMKPDAPQGSGGRKIDMLDEVIIVHTNEVVA